MAQANTLPTSAIRADLERARSCINDALTDIDRALGMSDNVLIAHLQVVNPAEWSSRRAHDFVVDALAAAGSVDRGAALRLSMETV